ncbi:uncharacterized protein MYCFIDRAFT_144082 [Pseudocercospora fijiensis CIRAD86]|uniref:Uncharacterized protein n=1 Tax=Pseudocercospora fijiensis (strain CIRAD86) TaxID=383855 RepID=M3AMC3_PSEFD|nr:uncharacterized protein MYCFIDRAFT_144082 [Pseudocercospora fijiensis CIRAD86]EME78253.1 hypothetical protein MYCFIDRAFT_144082 [Pseudocercospora fijiensis CIRAD86]
MPLLALAIGIYFGHTASQVYRSTVSTKGIAHELGTLEHGFVTEKIRTLPPHLYEIEQRRFTGSVGFLPDGTKTLVFDPAEPVYVGDPSPEIDRNWDELVEDRYWSISEDEAKMLWGVGHERYRDHAKGGYTGGFDVFHMLHCLNMLRKNLRPDYYPGDHVLFGGIEHNMHCIDQIRQRIQCSADGTITPLRYQPAIDYMYVDSNQVHTCRKFQNLWDYTRQRVNGSLAVPRIQW